MCKSPVPTTICFLIVFYLCTNLRSKQKSCRDVRKMNAKCILIDIKIYGTGDSPVVLFDIEAYTHLNPTHTPTLKHALPPCGTSPSPDGGIRSGRLFLKAVTKLMGMTPWQVGHFLIARTPPLAKPSLKHALQKVCPHSGRQTASRIDQAVFDKQIRHVKASSV